MRFQRGTTLISMMVGLLLAMISSIALMFCYRGVVLNAKSSMTNARSQNQAAAMSLQFMMTLAQAGWGIGPTASPPGGTANTDVVLLGGAALGGNKLSGTAATIGSAAATGNAVVWDTLVDGSMQCSGLLIVAGGVQELGPQTCSAATDWATLVWSSVSTAVATGTFSGANFSAVKTTCWPFGGGPGGQPALQVSLSGAGVHSDALCLSNVPN